MNLKDYHFKIVKTKLSERKKRLALKQAKSEVLHLDAVKDRFPVTKYLLNQDLDNKIVK